MNAPSPAKSPSSAGCLKIILLGLIFTILVGGGCIYFIHQYVIKPPIEIPKKIAKEALDVVKELFKPKGEIITTTEVTSGRPVEMYSLYEKTMTKTYTYKTRFLGSEKELRIEEEFVCRYGVDVTLEGVSASWSTPGIIRLDRVNTRLISCEALGHVKLSEDDGWWNKIQTEEREHALNSFIRQVRKEAAQDESALLVAKYRFQELIRREAKAQANGTELYAHFDNDK